MAMEDRYCDVVVRKEDQYKTDAIIQKHQAKYNIDHYYVEGRIDRDGRKVVYHLCLPVIDDLSVIKQDLVNNGIALF